MSMERYNFFKTDNVLFDETKEALVGNKGSSLTVNFVYFLSKGCFFTGLALLIVLLANLNNRLFNMPLYAILIAGFLFVALLTYGPLKVSSCKNALNMIRNTKPRVKDVWFGFKNKYFRNVSYGLCLFFSYLFHLILLIFPFFLKYFSYQLSGYVLADDLEIGAIGALKQSKMLMKGHRKFYLKLFFNYSPQMLLCVPTAYIYSLFLRPKFVTTIGCLYLDVLE